MESRHQKISSIPDKNLVFIVSAGRTGTQFFGKQLGSIIDDCVSAHEPDRYAGISLATWESIRSFGFNHVVLKRVLRKSGIRHLTQQCLAGKVTDDQLIQSIHQQRDGYIRKQSASLVVEAYYQWYGLLPCLRSAYPESKVSGIVRDPRSWVLSLQHRKLRHALGDLAGRLSPALIQDEEYVGRWADMSNFERACWEWKTLNGLIQTFVSGDPKSRLYRFEDLFEGDGRAKEMHNFLDFITDFGDQTYSYQLTDSNSGYRLNASAGNPVKWPDWSPSQARAMHSICGELMRELGYGEEPAWRKKIAID